MRSRACSHVVVTAFLVFAPAAPGPGLGADEPRAGSVDEIKTRDGRVYRGSVVGYDNTQKSYILRDERAGARIRIAEKDILTVESVPAASSSAGPVTRVGRNGDLPRSKPGALEAPVPRAGSRELLERLLRDLDRMLAPAAPEAREEFNEGVSRARERRFREAAPFFRRAVTLEPASAAARIFLAALLEASGDHAEALRAARPLLDLPTRPQLTEIIAIEAGTLGYIGLEREALGLWLEGADAAADLWRLFKYSRRRHPVFAARVWSRAIASDPMLVGLEGADGELVRAGLSALERGAPRLALDKFKAATTVNPWLGEFLTDHRVRALEGLIAKSAIDDTPERSVLELALAGETERARLFALATGENQREVETLAARRAVPLAKPKNEGRGPTGPDEPVEGGARSEPYREAGTSSAPPTPAPMPTEAQTPTPTSGRGESRESDEQEAALDTGGGVSEQREESADASSPRTVSDAVEQGSDSEGPGSDLRASSPRNAADVEADAPVDVDVSADESPTRYYPLVRGARWVFVHGDGSRDTVVLESSDSHPLFGRVHRFSNRIEFSGASYAYSKACFVDSESIFLGQSVDSTRAEPVLSLPVETGRKWVWRRGAKRDIECEREYVALDATVSTRAGIFESCVKVRQTSRLVREGATAKPVVRHYYFAPGVGLVKIEAADLLDNRELESFSVPGS